MSQSRVPGTFLASIQNADHGAQRKDVVVLGAGIAGLVAGYELSRLGHRVRIFEASSRIGGRIHTLDLADREERLRADVGAMRIPRAHCFTHHYVDVVGLRNRVVAFQTALQNEDCFIEQNGRVCRVKDAVSRFAKDGDFPRTWLRRSPYTAHYITALKILVDAVSPVEIRRAFAEDLRQGALDRVDEILAQEQFAFAPAELTPALALQHLPKLAGLWCDSVTTFLRDVALETAADLDTLEGGMDQLPLALANLIRGEIALDRPVSSLARTESGALIGFADGSQISAEYVICTIPFSVLRGLELVGFAASKLDAIRRVEYQDACKVFLLCRERFWERKKYGIFGGASISDQKFRQLYYPSHQSRSKRGVLLASYVIGDESKSLSRLDDDRLLNELTAMISRIHPEIAERGMVQALTKYSWERQPWAKGGCSVTYRSTSGGARDRADARELHAAVTRPDGRVYFAGEHCSEDRAWIEGAVTSALEQVRSIVTQTDD